MAFFLGKISKKDKKKIQERALRILFNDYSSDFEPILRIITGKKHPKVKLLRLRKKRICMFIVRTPPPPLFFFKGGGEVSFDYRPRRRESEKLKKEGGSMVQGQVFLKGGGVGR